MRATSVAWERAAEVRAAADGWRRAGAIDDATAARIGAAYPDSGETPTALWRALTAAAVSAVVLCLLGAVGLGLWRSRTALEALLFLFAALSVAATELLEADPRWARRGAAGATAFWSVALVLVSLALALADRLKLDDALDCVLAAAIVTWGLACWRWGSPAFAGLSAVALFALLARLPHGRLLWIAAGVALTGLAARRLDFAPWAPSHRAAAAVLVVAGITALYSAVNVYSLDERLIEQVGRAASPRGGVDPRVLAAGAVSSLAVVAAVLWWGLRARRTWFVDMGIALAALSALTLRHYIHVAPLWVVLVLAGASLVAVAIALERALRRAPDGQIRGFTAEPLFSEGRRALALEIVPSVAALGASAHGPSAPEDRVAGGRFGGAGASEKY